MAEAIGEQAGGMSAARKKPLMAVHDGAFHADDCTAYSIMKHLHPSLELVRTRDPEVIATADYVMDVGGEYDNITKFDHHQKSFTEKRNDEFNTKYAAAGLTWRKFGKDYVKKELELAEDDDATAERVAARVDRNYMRFLDANDNGIDVGVPREYPGVPSAVAMYNAVVGTKGNSGFLAAARMCEMILRGEVRSEYRYICAEAEMLKAAKEAKDGIIETWRAFPSPRSRSRTGRALRTARSSSTPSSRAGAGEYSRFPRCSGSSSAGAALPRRSGAGSAARGCRRSPGTRDSSSCTRTASQEEQRHASRCSTLRRTGSGSRAQRGKLRRSSSWRREGF